MFYIFLLFIHSIFASTSEVISTDLEVSTIKCEYSAMKGSRVKDLTYPPGVKPINLWSSQINTEEHTLKHTRLAAFMTRNKPYLDAFREHSSTPQTWPYFDYNKCASGPTPTNLLQMLYQDTPCHPINRKAIWKENIQGASTFTLIENLLEDITLDSHTKHLLSQLHAVGTLALAGLSKNMYTELSELFITILEKLDESSWHRKSELKLIKLPSKEHFLNTMHGNIFPWQNIGIFSPYTHWLIQYRANLAPDHADFDAEIHAIVTKQINAFLSPEWSFSRPWASLQADWRTALWVSEDYIKEFLEYSKTQSEKDCTFAQILERSERAAIGYLNATMCCTFYKSSLPAMRHAFHGIKFTHPHWNDKRSVWDAARPMLHFNIPLSAEECTSVSLLEPREEYNDFEPETRHTPHFVETPKEDHFIPGSSHLELAQNWHKTFSASYENVTKVDPKTLAPLSVRS